MTKRIILLAISTVLINCDNTTMKEQKNDKMKVISTDVKAPKVTGIGPQYRSVVGYLSLQTAHLW